MAREITKHIKEAFKDTQHFTGNTECMQIFLFHEAVGNPEIEFILEDHFHDAGLSPIQTNAFVTYLDYYHTNGYCYSFPVSDSEKVKSFSEQLRKELKDGPELAQEPIISDAFGPRVNFSVTTKPISALRRGG